MCHAAIQLQWSAWCSPRRGAAESPEVWCCGALPHHTMMSRAEPRPTTVELEQAIHNHLVRTVHPVVCEWMNTPLQCANSHSRAMLSPTLQSFTSFDSGEINNASSSRDILFETSTHTHTQTQIEWQHLQGKDQLFTSLQLVCDRKRIKESFNWTRMCAHIKQLQQVNI